MGYWIAKNEPTSYSIDDLEKDSSTVWDGVRNYQVRNMIRDDMKAGDTMFFYHSNADEIGVAGVMKIEGESYPDPTQFDKKSKYFDPKSKKENPTWYTVNVRFVEKFDRLVTLEAIKASPACKDIALVRKGNRLSITPIHKKAYDAILKMGRGEEK